MLKSLLTARRFVPLFWCQFCSALNDNFLKNALGMLILYGFGTELAAQDPKTAALLITLSGVIFIAPFFFLSALGGELADKYDKARVAERIKLAEIPVALLAATGFYLHSLPVLFSALLGFGIVGALFGPVKYGILPEKLSTAELSSGNALVEGATFMAILLGTIGGSIAVTQSKSPEIIVGIIVVLAISCWLFARLIPASGPAAPGIVITRNPLRSTFALLKELRTDKRLAVGGHVTSWFWLVGVVAMSLLPVLIKEKLGGSEYVYSGSLMVFTIGIAIGSLLAARVSHDRPNLALVPFGGAMIALFALGLALLVAFVPTSTQSAGLADFATSKRGIAAALCLFGLALGGGLYIVPAFAAVQSWAAPDKRARVIASVNVLNALYMTLAGAVLAGLQALGTPLHWLYGLLAAGTVVMIAFVLRSWGKEGVRDLGRMFFSLVYDLEVKGLEHLPMHGEATIIAPNHVSLLDAPMLHAALPREASFAVNTEIAEVRWIKPFLRFVNTYKLDPTRPLAARGLVNTVKAGNTVVIFPEGRITTTGSLMKVYDGAGMTADKADAWVVPVHIDGAAHAKALSYLRPTQIKKRWRPKVTITVLPPVKLALDPVLRGRARRQAAGLAMQDILVDARVRLANTDRTLFEALADSARHKSHAKVAVQDPLGTKLSMKKLMLGAQVLAAKLTGYAGVGDAIGVMLPNSAGVTVVFTALQSIGRVPAMINFSSGAGSIRATYTAAKVTAILTSKAFIEKGRMQPLVDELAKDLRIVYLDDIRASIGLPDKLRGLRAGLKPQVQRKPDDPAVILFTSGSEGTPKGVVLSHRNILTNIAQGLSRMDLNTEDRVFNALPVFHSFGLVVGTILPLVEGVPLYMYPTPLHYRIIPELVYDKEATVLFGTDTFLNGYARAAHPYDLRKVRILLAGAEAVKERTRQLYMDKFGARIFEGYGVTETSPGLAMGTPLSAKAGTLGRILPLIETRLEDVPGIPATQGDAKVGRLHVRGPNVMLGYLRAENPGVLEPPRDGWYDTGDIVSLDAQGYVRIMGRAKRFAKIGGEMVSLSAIEALASDLWPSAISVAAAEPDLRKGERVVLLTQEQKASRDAFVRHVRDRGLSELNIPAEVICVPAIPLLGSGKPDFVAAARLARELAVGRRDAA